MNKEIDLNCSTRTENRDRYRHKYPERGEMRVPTVEGEGDAQGELDLRRAGRFRNRWQPEILRPAPGEGISARLIMAVLL